MIDKAIASAINEIVDQFNALFSQRLTSVVSDSFSLS